MGMTALLDRLEGLLGSVDRDSLPLYLGSALAALLVLLLLTRGRRESSSDSGGRIRRAMSFTSAACAEGTYRHGLDRIGLDPIDANEGWAGLYWPAAAHPPTHLSNDTHWLTSQGRCPRTRGCTRSSRSSTPPSCWSRPRRARRCWRPSSRSSTSNGALLGVRCAVLCCGVPRYSVFVVASHAPASDTQTTHAQIQTQLPVAQGQGQQSVVLRGAGGARAAPVQARGGGGV
jgi:hypothetical protein